MCLLYVVIPMAAEMRSQGSSFVLQDVVSVPAIVLNGTGYFDRRILSRLTGEKFTFKAENFTRDFF